MVEHYQPVLDTLGVLVATYGAYKAAVVLAMVSERAAAIGRNVNVWLQLAGSIKSAADASALFNLTTGLNLILDPSLYDVIEIYPSQGQCGLKFIEPNRYANRVFPGKTITIINTHDTFSDLYPY